jgi:Mn-dependent DtxR family transcriptional regulator
MDRSISKQGHQEESLYIDTAEAESVEMYLINIDEEMVCGIEHHMKQIFTDALCTLLNHPRECPHRHAIPRGQCCLQ